ncbi:MAG TPA: sulfatase-like hydrolase/transferase [Acidimicrobiales bacterium]|nr:sulfatase-like hydrolase/transferase [Acidimicrobiales bacterium]
MVDGERGREQGTPRESRRPNILLVVSDQERQRAWLPPSVRLPWRDRLIAEGLEFTRYYTHSSPCSPSRASLITGRYLPGHGVTDNVIMPEHAELDPSVPTVGSLLRAAGYRSSYIGKWHLSQSEHPDMESYGFSDWDGNDRHFMGWAGTGVHFDPVIASNAAHWLRTNAGPAATGSAEPPWFLTVALVNPHDVMWFPVDQPGYRERHPEEVAGIRRVLESAAWKEDDALPIYTDSYEEIFEELPANFSDDLHAKPEAHRQWRWDQQHGLWGYIEPSDKKAWLRHLDYYVELHRLADRSLGTVLEALDDSGAADDTVVIFTSDHGDMCGSHGLRSKGPFVYDEIMRVPLYVRAPGLTPPGTAADALATHVDLAATICSLAGIDPTATTAADSPGLQGRDLSPVLTDPAASVRDHVLFAQDSAQTQNLNNVRYALRGFFDGTTKYARYYGVGGGKPSTGLWGKDPGRKLFDLDCAFDDQDHEWYDHDSDPLELVNNANDRSRRNELRDLFGRLRAYENEEMIPLAPTLGAP